MKKIIFELLKSSLCAEELDGAVKESITEQDLQGIFKLAKKHDLAHIVADVLDKNGLLPDNSQARKVFLQERNMAVFRYEQLNYDLERISAGLEEEKIEHIPLKGSVIRKFYSEPWLRTSCDIDILIRESDKERAKEVFENKLNCEYKSTWDYEQSFFTESGTHIELHHSLESAKFSVVEFLEILWLSSFVIERKEYRKALTNEMFYFYHFAHMAKHFEAGGCGIKPFMDLFIMERAMSSDEEKLSDLLTQGGLLAFANATRALSKVWFEEAEHTATTLALEEYILTGGVYGTLDNKVKAQQTKKGGKFKYMFSRIFLPYELLCLNYPILKKRKWLTPFYQVVRWCRVLFKGSANKSMRELNTSANMSKETQNKTQALLKDLGLM